jgi:MarR family transcriptional regulator, transcriptional regulator for hemolysin
MRPARTPIGLELARTAKTVSRAFDAALVAAGGSLPMWLILLSVKTRSMGNQRELAEAIGIKQATLTHHLNAMAESGLLTRERDPANRRVHIVTLTDAGEAAFHRLREAAAGFDKRLRRGISESQVTSLGTLLEHLAVNAAQVDEPGHKAGIEGGGNDG